MTRVKFSTLDDSAARAELIETIFDRDYDDVPIIGRTDKNYLVGGVAFVDGDSSIRFHHDNADEFGDIVEWAFVENPTTTTEDKPIRQILNWFKAAKPNPTDKDIATQLGAHFEEVAEMQFALGAKNFEAKMLSSSYYNSDSIHVYEDGNDVELPDDWKEQLLDACCDQIVTAVGVAYMLGMDIEGALAEVIRSNNSKFVDGKPLFNEHGKIVKPGTYSPPNLKPFLGDKA